jgi:hypothetical protein
MKFGILKSVGVRAGRIGSHTGNGRMDGDWYLLLKNLLLSTYLLKSDEKPEESEECGMCSEKAGL